MTRMAMGLVIVLTVLFLGTPVGSQSNSKTRIPPTPSPPSSFELESLRLQRERLEFDKEKSKADAQFEERKIEIEQSKAVWSAWGTAVPLIVGVVAIIFGVLNQHRQAKHQFELKAAEIIFSGTTPQAILSRGKALKTIFGNYLAKDFVSDFKPEDVGGYKEPSEEKRVFLEHIVKHPEKKAEIVKLWFELFPWDFKWLARIDPDQFKDSELPEIKEHLAKNQKSSPPKLVREPITQEELPREGGDSEKNAINMITKG